MTDHPNPDDFRTPDDRLDIVAFRAAVAAWDPNEGPAESVPVDDDAAGGGPASV